MMEGVRDSSPRLPPFQRAAGGASGCDLPGSRFSIPGDLRPHQTPPPEALSLDTRFNRVQGRLQGMNFSESSSTMPGAFPIFRPRDVETISLFEGKKTFSSRNSFHRGKEFLT